MTLTAFEALLKTVAPQVYHYEAHKAKFPYIVWAEYRKLHWFAENKPRGGVWRVQVDYYTPREGDPVAASLEALFAEHEIPFHYKVLYEPEIQKIRHLFDCEVVTYG